MKFKKVISFIVSILIIMSCFSVAASAADEALSIDAGIEALIGQFEYGQGPETDDYAIDYRYYSPAENSNTSGYPLVIWLHGMGDGAYDGKQIETNNIVNWSSAEYQSRFSAGGAYIFAPRSLEEKGIFWSDGLIFPLRVAIDDFIANNNVDTSRIYIGGYSMGGKMTLKMAVAYPEMFAAAFPICPAWTPGEEATALISDIPVWLVSSAADPLVNYFSGVMPVWKNIIAQSSVADDCRFSTLSMASYADGTLAPSSHHSWYAVSNDMFSAENGDFPRMKTVDGNGEKVELVYPEGMISWLCGFSSDFDGTAAVDGGNSQARADYSTGIMELIKIFLENFIEYILASIKMA